MTRRRVVFTAFSVDLASSAADAFAAGAFDGALVVSPDFPSDISGIGPFNYCLQILKYIKAQRSRSKNIGLYAVGIPMSSGYGRSVHRCFRRFAFRTAVLMFMAGWFCLRHHRGDTVAFSDGPQNEICQRSNQER